MQTPTCPQCGKTIEPADVNVASDRVFCRACHVATPLSDLIHHAAVDPHVDLASPPSGAWYRDNGTEKVIGATGRSLPGAIGMLLIAVIWNGIVSIFVMFAASGVLRHMNRPLPAWAPTMMVDAGTNMSLAATICLCLFLTPFVLIGLALPFAVLNYVIGSVEVQLSGPHGALYQGYGGIGRKKPFEIENVKSVRIDVQRQRGRRTGDPETFTRCIMIELKRGDPIKFGAFLAKPRMNFMHSALAAALDGTRHIAR